MSDLLGVVAALILVAAYVGLAVIVIDVVAGVGVWLWRKGAKAVRLGARKRPF